MSGLSDSECPYRILRDVTGQTDIWSVDAEELTHINYAFARMSDADTVGFENNSAGQRPAELQSLKAEPSDLKRQVGGGGRKISPTRR